MSYEICHDDKVWRVEFESTAVQTEIEILIRNGKLTKNDQAIINSWIRQVAFHGPESVRGDYKWADHALRDKWRGYRASAFSNRGRIIYRIEGKLIRIVIARITDSHDYDKKEGEER